MSTTLDAYRSIRPDDTRPDDEVLEGLVNQFTNDGSISQFPDLLNDWQQLQKKKRLDQAPGYLQEGSQAVGSGINLMQAKLYEGTAGLAGGVLGIDALKNFGLEGYRRNLAEAQEYQPTVAQSTDVDNVDTAIRYGLGVVGQNVPQFAATAGLAAGIEGAGFLAGGPAGALAAAPYAVGASTVFGGIQNQNYADLLEQGGENPEMTALAVGAVSGYLETLVPLKMLNKFKGSSEELKPWLNEVVKTIDPTLRRSLLKAAAENTVGEGITEGAQEAVAIAGEMFSNRNNPNFLLDPTEVTRRIRENVIAGALVGGITSPIEGVADYYRNRKVEKAPEPSITAPPPPMVVPPVAPVTPPTTQATEAQADELPLKVSETISGKTTEVPLTQYLATRTPETQWSELEPVESGNDIVLRPKQEQLQLGEGAIEVQTTPAKTALPALKQGVTDLPELEAPVERFPDNVEPTMVSVTLKDRMLEHSTKGAPTGATKRLFAYQDKTTGEVYVAGAYLGTGKQVFLHTGQDQLPTRADVARELDVSEAAVQKALSPNPETRTNTDLAKRIREHVHGMTYGLRKKNMALHDLLELKTSSGETRFKPLASVTLKGLALQNASPWDVSTDFRLKYDSLADFEKVAGVANEKATKFQEIKADVSSAKESRSRLYTERMSQLEDGQKVSHAINILSSILENDALKSSALKVTPNSEAMTLGLMRLWNPNNLARELSRATSAYDLLGQTASKKTGARKFWGFMDETEFKDFVDAANSGDADLIKSTLDDVLAEKDKSLRWFSMRVASIGDARQTHFSQVRDEADADPDASIVQDPEAVETTDAQPDAVLTEDSLQDVDTDAPAKAVSFIGLTPNEQTTIRKALELVAPDVYKGFKDRDGNVIKPVADWQNDAGFLAAKPILRMAIERTLSVSRKEKVVLSDEALYGAYLNGPVTVKYTRPLQASYRASTGSYRQLYYDALQTMVRRGVETRVIEQDISSLVEQIKNEWGQAKIYDSGRRVVTLTVADILNPTKENFRVLLHEAAHIVLADEPKWVQQAIHDAVNRSASLKEEVLYKTKDANLQNMYGTELADEILAEHLSYMGIEKEKATGMLGKIHEFLSKIFNQVAAMYYKWRGLETGNNAVKYIEARFNSFMLGEAITLQTLDTLNGTEQRTIGEQALMYRQSGGDVEVERLNPDNGMIEPMEVLEDSTLATVLNLDTAMAAYDVAKAAEGIPAPAVYQGFQEGTGKIPGFELYNLTEDIEGHPAGSTVSRQTLEQAGFTVPPQTQNTQPEVPGGFFLSGTLNLEQLLRDGKAGKIKLAKDGTIGSQEVKSFLANPDTAPGANTAEWNYLKSMGIEEMIKGNRVEVSKLLAFVKAVQPALERKELKVKHQGLSDALIRKNQAQHVLETAGFQVKNPRMNAPGPRNEALDGPSLWKDGKEVELSELEPDHQLYWKRFLELDNTVWYMGADSDQGLTDSASANYQEVNPLSNVDLARKGGVDLLMRVPTVPLSEEKWKIYGGFKDDVDPDSVKFTGPHYGESDKNVVVSIRGHFENLGGKKVFSINEVQGDWPQAYARHPSKSDEQIEIWNSKARELSSEIFRSPEFKGLQKYYKDLSDFTIGMHVSPEQAVLQAPDNISSPELKEKARELVELREKSQRGRTGVMNHPTLSVHQELGLKMAMQYAVQQGAEAIVLPDSKTVMMTEMHDKVPVESKNYLTREEAQKDADRANAVLEAKHGSPFLGGDFARVEKTPKGTWYIHISPSRVFMLPKTMRDEMNFRVYSATGMEINYDQKLPAMAEKLTGSEGAPVSLGKHQNGPSLALNGKTDITGRMYDLSAFKAKLNENKGNSIFYARWTRPVDLSWQKLPYTTGQYHHKIGLNQNTGTSLKETLAGVLKQPDLDPKLRAIALALQQHWSADRTMVYVARDADETQIGNHSTAGYVEWNRGRMVLNPFLTYAQVRASPEEVLLHEAVHAATASVIEAWHMVNNHKSALTPEDRTEYRKVLGPSFKHVEDLSFILRYLQKNFPDRIAVGEGDNRRTVNAFRNLHEFVADLFTERSVSEFLKEVTLPKSLSENKENAFFTVIRKVLEMLGIKGNSALYSAANTMTRILDATNSPEAKAALQEFNDQVTSDYRLQGGGDGDPKAKFLPKPVPQGEAEAKLKYQLEYHGAIINSRIHVFEELFGPRADALQMSLSKYITDILRLNDPYEQRETWQLAVHNRPLPVPVNENLSIFPKDKSQTILNPVMKQHVTRSVYKHIELAKTKMQADQTKLAHDAKIAEKKLTRAQLNASRLDEYLNNVLELKSDILKDLKSAVREVTRDLGRVLAENDKLSSLGNVLQQLLAKGLPSIPENYRGMFEQILSEAESSFVFTDALTAMAKLDIDWRNSDAAVIRDQIYQAYNKNHDPALKPFMGVDDISQASISIAIYYGKFNPRVMATLALRTEKVAADKVAAVRAITRIIEGTEPNLAAIDEMIQTGIKESGVVARVKVEFRQAQLNFGRIKRQLDNLKKRTSETEAAIPKIKERISEVQSRLGIAAENFNIAQGAPVILTPDVSAMSGELKTTPLDLKAANSTKALTQIWIDNGKWLAKHADQKDATWMAIDSQRAAIEKALGDQSVRHIKDFYVGKFLFSIPQKLIAVGLPITRRMAGRWGDYFSKRISMDAAQARGHEIVTAWKRAIKLTGVNPENFSSLFWNPGNRYIETTAYLLGPDASENKTKVKEGLRQYYMGNPQIAELFRAKPETFDSIWNALETNYIRGSNFMAQQAQKWNVLVEDDFGKSGFRIDNPRGGVSRAYRKHMEVGYATTQRSVKNLAPVVRLMEKIWANAEEGLTPETYHTFFTPEITRLFVVPFIDDITYQHFPGPTMADGKTRFYASIGNVQEAWAGANGDIGAFARNLFALEKGIAPQAAVTHEEFPAYFDSILKTFSKKFFQMHSILERSSVASNKLGLDSLPHQLMDAREADNLPAEFLDYILFTPTTIHIVANQLAAVSAFGRDLGITASRKEGNRGLMWEMTEAIKDLEDSISDANSRRALLRAHNPLASQKQIENVLEKELGSEEYARIRKVPEKINELKKIQDETYLYFRRPNGDTKDVSWFMEGVRTLAGLMVNNFKTTAFATMTLFDHLFGLRLNKSGMSVVKNNWTALVKTGWTSVAEAFGMQLSRTSENAQYLRRFKDLGIMQDLGNMIDSESILADPGHKESYLNDSKVLGYLRKGRQFYFNLGVKTETGVKLRPLAPFTSGNMIVNISAVVGSLSLYRQLLDQASNHFLMGRMQTDYENAGFMFKASDFPDMAPDAYAELRAQFEDMGTTLEIAARKVVENKMAGKLGLEQIPDDLTRNIAAQTIRNVTLQSDISTAPPWLFTNSFGRMVSPLLTWPLARIGQIMKSMGDANGEVGLASVRSFLALMLFGIVPAGIAMTMLLDKYDEDILGKKSNLVSFSANGDVNQNLTALVERLGRAGTFGLAGDVVNGARIYGTDGDLRGLSFDQRVLFANTLLTTMGLVSTVAHQGGDVTYATFWRPLVNTMGGNGYIQNAQILNNLTNSVTGSPVFEGEAQVTARINAQNYIRAAGRVLNMDVRVGSGQRSVPTPVKPWITNMVLAAYAQDNIGFVQAYQKSLTAAREMGQEDPEEYVRRSFATYHPLKSLFRTAPTSGDVARMYTVMGSDGARDVRGAVLSFDAFGKSIGLKPFDPKETATQKKLPSLTYSAPIF